MEYDVEGVRDVRRVLWQWGQIDRRIADLMEQMRIAVARIDSVYQMSSSRAMDGKPHGTGTSDPVFRAVEKIAKMRELFAQEVEVCEQQIKEAQEFKASINEAMQCLTPVQRDVVKLRYQEGHYWPFIAVKLYMSEKTARRYDVQACGILAKKISVRKS